MSDHYKISAPDGTEYFVTGLPALQRLYRERSIAADVLIQKLPIDTWMPMNEMYDISQWDSMTIPETQIAGTESATPYGFGAARTPGFEIPSNRGMRAAGILFMINALISILLLLAIGARGARNGSTGGYSIAIIIDVLVGINLLRGQWRSSAVSRVCLGAVIYGLIFPLVRHTPLAIITGVFQLCFSGGFLILLYKEFISTARMLVGVGVVAFCWLAISVTVAVSAIYPALSRTDPPPASRLSEVSASALPIQHFETDDKVASLDPPDGWVLLKRDNSIVPAATAAMVAIHPQSDCYAALVIEDLAANLGDDSVSLYVSLVEENQKKSVPSFTVLNQIATQFGNNTGQRIEVTWQHEKTKVHGWRSFCKSANGYYMLSGWCLEGEQTTALPQYIKLEKSFSLTERKTVKH